MLGLMMDFPLAVPAILERAGGIFGDVEIVARRPDRTLARPPGASFTGARSGSRTR